MRVFLLSGEYNKDGFYALRAKEKQYLSKVLRLKIGTVFTAKDKKENYYRAELIDEDTLSLESSACPEETLLDGLSGYKGEFHSITMFLSLLKGKKNELVVRALTEMGIERIVFVRTQFVQEKELTSHQIERLDAIVKEATRFCFQRHIAYLKPRHDIIDCNYLHGAILSSVVQEQIEAKVKGIAQKTLAANLRILEGAGLVSRQVFAEVPPRVEYTLTEAGQQLRPVLDSLAQWSREIRKED